MALEPLLLEQVTPQYSENNDNGNQSDYQIRCTNDIGSGQVSVFN